MRRGEQGGVAAARTALMRHPALSLGAGAGAAHRKMARHHTTRQLLLTGANRCGVRSGIQVDTMNAICAVVVSFTGVRDDLAVVCDKLPTPLVDRKRVV